MFSPGKIKTVLKIAAVFLSVLTILSVNVVRLRQEHKGLEVSESSIIRDRFKKIRRLDSLHIWNSADDWIYDKRRPMNNSLFDDIKTTNYRYYLDRYYRKYKWYNSYSRQKMEISLEIPKSLYYEAFIRREALKDFSPHLNRVEDYLVKDFLVYRSLYLNDAPYLYAFSQRFRNLPLRTKDTLTETAYNVISFVQNFPYENMDNLRCYHDTMLVNTGRKLKSSVSKEILAASVPVKHEVFSPVEFLKHGVGDCDSRTLLAFTILNNLGYDALTLRVHVYESGRSAWHSLLAISGVANAGKYYFTYKKKKYYYVELTKPNWWIGELTPGQKKYGRLIGIDMPYPALKWSSLIDAR